MNLPTFLIIGAARSGTTSLYEYCKQHPQVFMSPRKETNFLAYEGEPLAGRSADRERWADRAVASLEEYAGLFSGCTSEIALGEASPRYLYRPARAIANIKKHVPEARLIAILRDPVERAYSHYLLRVRVNRERRTSFAAAVEAESRRMEKGRTDDLHYIPYGLYGQQLRLYYDAFPSGQIRVYLYDDLARDAAGVMADLFAFVGVEPAFPVDVSTRHRSASATAVPTHPLWAFVHRRLSSMRETHAWPVRTLRRFVRDKVRQQAGETPPLTPEARAWLLERYRGDILRLQDLIGRDLRAWLQ
jgi:hypothetical protein